MCRSCLSSSSVGCMHGKVDRNTALVYENHNFLVKGLKVVAQCCLNWNFVHDDLCCCVKYSNVENQVEIFNIYN